MTDEEKEILKKFLPWVESVLKGRIIQEKEPQNKEDKNRWLKPSHGFGWSNHPNLTFGDLVTLRDLIAKDEKK